MTRKLLFSLWVLFLLLGMVKTSQAQGIRLDLRETDLAKVVAALQQQAPSVNFTYSQESLEKVKITHVQVKADRLQTALEQLQKRYGLHFLMDGANVTLKYVPVAPPVEAPMSEARRIEGTVTEENGQPVQGATVHVKGTQISAPTNERGVFVIDAAAGAHLEIGRAHV